MATEYARSGDVVDVLPADSGSADARSIALVHEDRLEVMRLMLPAGKHMPEHLTFGPITMHCLAGSVDIVAGGARRRLSNGQLMYLEAGVPHAVQAIEAACLLVTMVLVDAAVATGAPENASGQGADTPRHGERTGD